MSYNARSCSIFVDTSLTRVELRRFLEKTIPQFTQRWGSSFAVVTNKESPQARSKPVDPAGLFLYYPLKIEFDPPENNTLPEEAVTAVTLLVRTLKQAGYDAIPACSYEDSLPRDVRYQ